MANSGKNTNQSQFYITTVGNLVAFHGVGKCSISGQEISGLRDGVGGVRRSLFNGQVWYAEWLPKVVGNEDEKRIGI